MSLSSWLENLRQRRRERAIAKHRKKIKNKFGFGEDRQRAVEFFQGLGGKVGTLGLLERFMVNIDHTIRDEEEKERLFRILVEAGNEVIPAIDEYLNRRDATRVPVTWPLKVLVAVAEPAEVVTVISKALQAMGTGYTTDPERKVSLLAQLAEQDDPRVVPVLLPFLRDHRDEVQLEALSALTRRADEAAREPMLVLLVDPETPLRLKGALAGALRTLGWEVKGYRKKVEENLPEGLFVDRSGRIKGHGAKGGQDTSDE
jgi:DNA-binding protein YbaB